MTMSTEDGTLIRCATAWSLSAGPGPPAPDAPAAAVREVGREADDADLSWLVRESHLGARDGRAAHGVLVVSDHGSDPAGEAQGH